MLVHIYLFTRLIRNERSPKNNIRIQSHAYHLIYFGFYCCHSFVQYSYLFSVSSFLSRTVNDETDTESVKLRIREPMNEKPPPKPIQLKIRKNWTELVCRRIYILTWIRHYDQTTAYSDFIAGVTLGLTMIPQASLIDNEIHYDLFLNCVLLKKKNAYF